MFLKTALIYFDNVQIHNGLILKHTHYIAHNNIIIYFLGDIVCHPACVAFIELGRYVDFVQCLKCCRVRFACKICGAVFLALHCSMAVW